jgi:hypothetical protein
MNVYSKSDASLSDRNTRDATHALLMLPEHAAVGIVEPNRRVALLSHAWWTCLDEAGTAAVSAKVIVAAFAVPVEQAGNHLEEPALETSTSLAALHQFWTDQLWRKSLQQVANCLPQSTFSCRYVSCLAEAAREPLCAQTRLGVFGQLRKPPSARDRDGWFVISDLDCGATAIVTYSVDNFPLLCTETSSVVYFFHQLRLVAWGSASSTRPSGAAASASLLVLGLAWTPHSRATPLTIAFPCGEPKHEPVSCHS